MALDARPTGPVAAATLAVGIGSTVFGLAVVASERIPAFSKVLNLYNATGPLSGKTACGIVAWLIAWALLSLVWKGKEIRLKQLFSVSLILVAVGFVLTFPPVFDALAGK